MSLNKLGSDWDSGNDTALLESLHRVENLQQKPEVSDEEVDTDIDDNQPIIKSQKEWGSLNNSQFIDYVNQLSSFHQESKIGNSFNHSILFGAQRQSDDILTESVYSNPEALTEKDEKRAKEHAFDDHETYFVTKANKQRLQDEEYVAFMNNQMETSNIFENCFIHVNGRTDPDIMTLRKLIVLHGGKFIHHLTSKGKATHVVAEHLPPKKRQEFANCRVVKPAWIVDSISKKKMQNWAIYRIEGLNPFGQKQIIPTSKGIKLGDKLEVPDIEHTVDLTCSDLDLQEDEQEEVDQIEKEQNEAKEQEIENEIEDNQEEYIDHEEVINIEGREIDAKHPEFLRQFFAKSRLHYLSTWKSNLRSNFLHRAIKVLSERELQLSSRNRVILHVDFDCFFATVSAMKHNPPLDIDKVPICVTHGGKSSDVASCNYVARKFGLTNGMWLSSARKLCPNLICLKYEFDEYQIKSNLFYEYLLQLNINSILPVSVDEALVDISALCVSEEKNVEDLLRDIKKALDEITGCSVSCGAGSNVLLAKLALRKAKPNGIYYIEDSLALDEIENVSFEKLPGIGHKMYEKLSSHLRKTQITLADIRLIPKNELSRLFGEKTGLMIYNYALGQDSTSIDILSNPDHYVRKSLGIDINWGIRFDDDIQTEEFLNRLAAELNKRLMDVNMMGSSLTLKLSVRRPEAPIEPTKFMGMGSCYFVSKTSKLGVATRETSILASEMRYNWRYMNIEPKDLRGVSVNMGGLVTDDFVMKQDVNQMKLQFKKIATKKSNNNGEKGLVLKEPTDLKYEPIKSSKTSIPTVLNDISDSKSKFDIGNHFNKLERLSPTKQSPQSEEQIDWEVFQCLPTEIQDEIKKELRRRQLRASPKKKRVYNNEKDIAFMVSPSKRKPKPTIEKFAIPKKDINIIFQGISIDDFDLIKDNVFVWIVDAMEANSVNDEDLELFNNFVSQLLLSHSYSVFWELIEWLRVIIDNRKSKKGYHKWNIIINNFESMFKEQNYTEIEAYF